MVKFELDGLKVPKQMEGEYNFNSISEGLSRKSAGRNEAKYQIFEKPDVEINFCGIKSEWTDHQASQNCFSDFKIIWTQSQTSHNSSHIHGLETLSYTLERAQNLFSNQSVFSSQQKRPKYKNVVHSFRCCGHCRPDLLLHDRQFQKVREARSAWAETKVSVWKHEKHDHPETEYDLRLRRHLSVRSIAASCEIKTTQTRFQRIPWKSAFRWVLRVQITGSPFTGFRNP